MSTESTTKPPANSSSVNAPKEDPETLLEPFTAKEFLEKFTHRKGPVIAISLQEAKTYIEDGLFLQVMEKLPSADQTQLKLFQLIPNFGLENGQSTQELTNNIKQLRNSGTHSRKHLVLWKHMETWVEEGDTEVWDKKILYCFRDLFEETESWVRNFGKVE